MSDAEAGQKKSIFDSLQRMAAIASSITIIVGVITAVIQLRSTLNQANDTMSAIKLQALQQITGLVDKNYDIRRMQREFLQTDIGSLNEKMRQKISEGATGEDVYLSEELELFRNIASHYERVGTILDLKYLNFDVLFDIIPFPDNFWEKTRSIRLIIGKNWYGKDNSLDDFLGEFAKLCASYKEARKREGSDRWKSMDCRAS